ncbi:coiled-coil domain-containing protein 191 [Phascolarctos cinereus]|uniref:Coiled-coil domain-containing protein 191 isoform X2 n=1 Tax=Phascolarctos cinereus TaxID=38626 RepID=A0A6P5LW72_PHACI|nr:coiled-coil domain-containing protein 191 isoform X2 [Phascolarctos cinereus]
MPVGTRELASSGKRTDLYRWKRFTKKANPKHDFDSENLEYWTKRVEKASEFAVSEVFSPRNANVPRRPWGKVVDLETTEQLVDHDEAHEEAQELLNDWMNSKLKMELTNDKEDDEEAVPNVTSSPEENGTVDPVKYENFDDLYGHLEEEEESTTVKQFIDHLLHKDIVDSGVLEDHGVKENQEKKKQKDPCLIMEMRHKQVKENRLRRQKELERQRAEKALKKSAFTEAQYLVQEEKKKKALKVKKEEEEIQKEMVKLRKQMVERRCTVQEAWKIERKKQEEKSQKRLEKVSFQNTQVLLNEEKVAKEKKKKQQELLARINLENHQCLQKYFSAWKKMVFEHKLKMKKAEALADWKCQIKFLQAWRIYTRIQKLAQETQAMEASVKEQVRKQQLATDFNRRRILRHYFTQWQHLYRKETGRRQLELKKEETRKKMDELLKAASLGKLSSNGFCDILNREKRKSQNPSTRKEEVPVTFSREKPSGSEGSISSPPLCKKPKSVIQVPIQQAPPNSPELPHSNTPSCESLHQICSGQQSRTPSQKSVSPYMGHFHNRHIFQQQVIEEQKKKLQEQKKIILELQLNQRLREAREEAERATAVTAALTRLMSNPREEKMKKGCHILSNSPGPSSGIDSPKADSQSPLNASRKKSKQLLTPHPILKAMEERAAQRSERKKVLAEIKKKQEEEKLAQLKAQEEARQRKEAEEKEIQLEKRREEKRLKKMRELEKQRRAERNQQLQAKAKDHYERALLRGKGLEPWKRLLSQSKHNMEVAENHYCSTIQRKYLLTWFHYNQESLAKKKAQADKLYSQILLKRAFRSWLEYKDSLTIAEEKARKFNAAFLQKNIFMSWLNMVREEKIDAQKKLQIAIRHSDRRILSTIFQTWKKLPKLMKEEKLKEERREELRKKVAEILPDFRTVSSV